MSSFLTIAAMPKYKKPISRLKDPSRFQGYHAEEKYKEIIESRKILEKKGVSVPTTTLRNHTNSLRCYSKKRLARVLQAPKRPCVATGQRILCQHARIKPAKYMGKKLSRSLRPPSY